MGKRTVNFKGQDFIIDDDTGQVWFADEEPVELKNASNKNMVISANPPPADTGGGDESIPAGLSARARYDVIREAGHIPKRGTPEYFIALKNRMAKLRQMDALATDLHKGAHHQSDAGSAEQRDANYMAMQFFERHRDDIEKMRTDPAFDNDPDLAYIYKYNPYGGRLFKHPRSKFKSDRARPPVTTYEDLTAPTIDYTEEIESMDPGLRDAIRAGRTTNK